MRRRITVVTVLFCAWLLAGCAITTPEPPGGVAEAPTIAAPAAPQDTVAPPAEMPTAVPLWTDTPPAEPPVPVSQATPQEVSASAALEPGVVATVNGTPIAREEWERQVGQAQAYLLQQPGTDLTTEAGKEALRQVQEQVLDWMIDQALIEQAAHEAGIRVTPEDIEAQIAQMRGGDAARFDAWLTANGLTLDLLRGQVRADLMTAAVRDLVTAQIPRDVAQYHVRHILVSDEMQAQAALARIRGGENFITVARETSEDETTRNSGGDLGFLPKGVMPPAFEEAAYALQPGEVSDVVQSEFGYHVIQLVEVDPALAVPDELWPVVQQRGFDDWLTTQRANATIQRSM